MTNLKIDKVVNDLIDVTLSFNNILGLSLAICRKHILFILRINRKCRDGNLPIIVFVSSFQYPRRKVITKLKLNIKEYTIFLVESRYLVALKMACKFNLRIDLDKNVSRP